MKKIVLTSAIILTALVTSFAQTTPATPPMTVSSGTTSLSVVLNKVQSIVVNDLDVTLAYVNIDNYNNGVTKTMPNHLTVYSVGGFVVQVKSGTDDLTGSGADENIKASSISVKASGNALATVNYAAAVPLTTVETTLFSSTAGGLNEQFDVTYVGDKDLAYANADKFKEDQATTTHTTTVTYSIIAQ